MPRKVRLHFWVPCVWCCCCCCCFCGGISLSMKWYCYVSFSGWNAHKYLCSLNLCSIFYCFVAFDFFRSLSLSTSYFINSSEFDSLYSVFSWIWTRAFVFTTLPLTHGCYQWTLLLWVSLYQYCIVALAHSHTHTYHWRIWLMNVVVICVKSKCRTILGNIFGMHGIPLNMYVGGRVKMENVFRYVYLTGSAKIFK